MADAVLWRALVSATERSLASGALAPIATELEVVEDGGVAFAVRLFAHLDIKEHANREQRRDGTNPFLPPDPDLFVAKLTPTHVAVLNKFTVFPHHLLLVTRRFVSQESLLEPADLEALAVTMAEVDGLGFYNAGVVAGASQPHRHLQVVPTPLGPGPLATPVDPLLLRAPVGRAGRVSDLPFPHAALRLEDATIDSRDGPELHQRYRELLDAAGIQGPRQPYNLLLTRRWMLLVPRTRECWEGTSVNALGFAGSLLVRDRRRLERLRHLGPMRVLAEVAGAYV
jgi:ATP adenylyltransferase